jgi:hypothetical protein
MTLKEPKIIIPEREKCDCGKRVLNHHWKCDECYSKAKREMNKRNKKRDCFNPPKWMLNKNI